MDAHHFIAFFFIRSLTLAKQNAKFRLQFYISGAEADAAVRVRTSIGEVQALSLIHI